jgi:hypothetical protein
MIFVRVVTAAALVFGLAVGARAGVLYDNLSVATATPAPVAASGPLYNSFTTGGTGLVDTVRLLLAIGGAPNSNGIVDVAIYADSGDTPGGFVADVGTVNDTDLSGIPSVVPFTGLGDALTPNTRYWIGLTDDTFPLFGTTSIEWERAVDASGVGVAGEFNADSTAILPNGDGTSGTGLPNAMLVSTPVSTPEPASFTILGLALVGLVALHRRST